MPENRLSIGDVSFPAPRNEWERSLLIALEDLIAQVRDNTDYLLKPGVLTITATTTITDLESTILGDASGGDIVLNLPEAATVRGKIYYIKNIGGTGKITVTPSGSETIDGAASEDIVSQYDALIIQSDGSNWHDLAAK